MNAAIKGAAVSAISAFATYIALVVLRIDSPYPATITVAIVMFISAIMLQRKAHNTRENTE